MFAGTAGVAPSSKDATSDVTFTSVSDSEKSGVCLATGNVVLISSGDALAVAWAKEPLIRAPAPTDDDDTEAEPTGDTAVVVKR